MVAQLLQLNLYENLLSFSSNNMAINTVYIAQYIIRQLLVEQEGTWASSERFNKNSVATSAKDFLEKFTSRFPAFNVYLQHGGGRY